MRKGFKDLAFTDPYLIPGSNCLANKLGISDADQLAILETEIVFARDQQIMLMSVPGKYDAQHLSLFHRRLFSDIYAWAGRLRNVQISKATSTFCHPQFLQPQLSQLFDSLHEDDVLLGLPLKDFITKLSFHYGGGRLRCCRQPAVLTSRRPGNDPHNAAQTLLSTFNAPRLPPRSFEVPRPNR